MRFLPLFLHGSPPGATISRLKRFQFFRVRENIFESTGLGGDRESADAAPVLSQTVLRHQ
jgi:hypothetical protein